MDSKYRQHGVCVNCGRADCKAPETPRNTGLWHLYSKTMQRVRVPQWKAILDDCEAHTTDWIKRALDAERKLTC